MKEKIIYTRRIAYELRKPQYDIYYFENTPELLKALSEIKEGLQICQYQIRK